MTKYYFLLMSAGIPYFDHLKHLKTKIRYMDMDNKAFILYRKGNPALAEPLDDKLVNFNTGLNSAID